MQSRQRGPLAGKRVLVTGAAGAIGSATCAELRRRGACVVGLDRRGGEGIIQADVTSSEAVERAVAQALNELGGLDILINLAGIGLPQDAGTPPGEDVASPWRS